MWEFIKAIAYLVGMIGGFILLLISEPFRLFLAVVLIFVFIAYIILSIMNAIAKFLENNI
ncbi:hypothetical protein E0494_10155 [Marinilabiliaceae bacterium JC040]|nr:hypothetical protein [Marinilabiliaceae bacterium JC040]